MEVQPTKKKCKVEEYTTYKEEVLFNSDTLSKIISYLPSIDLLNLGLTCKRFGIHEESESVIKKSTRIAIHDIATEEQLAALPHYNGESTLADYHYLQLMKAPLTFDQLVMGAEYVNSGDKSCVAITSSNSGVATAFSNNILRAGKHYATFEVNSSQPGNTKGILVGLMRPGRANQNASGSPLHNQFFSQYTTHDREHNNASIQCCLYGALIGYCYSSDWPDGTDNVIVDRNWEGKESISSGDKIGMLLDLDEGTLSVYKNGRKLGVMKRGLAGPYCWVVTMISGTRVTIKRGVIPPS